MPIVLLDEARDANGEDIQVDHLGLNMSMYVFLFLLLSFLHLFPCPPIPNKATASPALARLIRMCMTGHGNALGDQIPKFISD